MYKLVIFDYSSSSVHYYDVPFTYTEYIESFIVAQGHRLSDCSWMTAKHIEVYD